LEFTKSPDNFCFGGGKTSGGTYSGLSIATDLKLSAQKS